MGLEKRNLLISRSSGTNSDLIFSVVPYVEPMRKICKHLKNENFMFINIIQIYIYIYKIYIQYIYGKYILNYDTVYFPVFESLLSY